MVGAAYTDLITNRKYMSIALIIQSAICLLLVVTLVIKDETVVVVPWNIANPISISGSAANEEYQKQFAFSVALLAGNVDPINVNFVTDTLSDMLSPFLRSQIRPTLIEEAKLIKLKQVTQSYTVKDMMYSPRNKLVWVWGEKKVVPNKSSSERSAKVDTWTYEIRIEPKDGHPRITHFRSYKGTPRSNRTSEDIPDNPYNTQEQTELADMGEPNTESDKK